MALADINGYKAYWENPPYPSDKLVGDSFGGSVSFAEGIPYRLLLPKNYNSPENATKKYPLMLWIHGTGSSYTTDEAKYNISQITDWSIASGYNTTTASYNDFDVIMLLPQFSSQGSRSNKPYVETSFENTLHSFYADDQKSYVVELLVRAAIAGELDYYLDASFTTQDTSADQLRIDEDRVYYSGASMGGYTAFSHIRRIRDVFAAIAPTHGGYGAISASTTDNFYINEFSKHKHIAKLLLTGTADLQYSGMQEAEKITRENYPETPLVHVTVSGMGHSITGNINIFDKTLKFDPKLKTEQTYGYDGEDAICGMDWLLQQTKQETPVDLFPEGEETLWTDRLMLNTTEDDLVKRIRQIFIPEDFPIWWKHLGDIQELSLAVGERIKENGLMVKRVSPTQYRLSNNHEYFLGV